MLHECAAHLEDDANAAHQSAAVLGISLIWYVRLEPAKVPALLCCWFVVVVAVVVAVILALFLFLVWPQRAILWL